MVRRARRQQTAGREGRRGGRNRQRFIQVNKHPRRHLLSALKKKTTTGRTVGPAGWPEGRESAAGTRVPGSGRAGSQPPASQARAANEAGPPAPRSRRPHARPPTASSPAGLPQPLTGGASLPPRGSPSPSAAVRAPPRGGVRRARPPARCSRIPAAPPLSREAAGVREVGGEEEKGGALNGGGWFCAGSGRGAGAIVLRCRLLCLRWRPRTPRRKVMVWSLRASGPRPPQGLLGSRANKLGARASPSWGVVLTQAGGGGREGTKCGRGRGGIEEPG